MQAKPNEFIIKKYLMEDFAELLKTSRENWKPKKISLKKLAKAIDNICSDAYLSQLENRRYKGKKGNPMRPDKEIVVALAKFFGWDLNHALTLAGHPPEKTSVPQDLASTGYLQLSNEDKAKAAEFINFLKSQRKINV